MRFVLPGLIVIALIALLGYGLTRDPGTIPSALIGKPAPVFELPRLGQPEGLLTTTDLAGQVSVVNVWASWCVGCRVEHPLLEKLAEQTNVALYGLNYKDERTAAQRWLGEYGNPYRASGYDRDGSVGIEWGVAAVPETFVLDARGIVRYKHTGAITREALEQDIIPLVERLQDGAG